MLGVLIAAVVYAAACHYENIAILADEEVVVYSLLQPALAEHDGDMNALVGGTVLDSDIDAAAIGLGLYVYVCGSIPAN